MKTFFHKLILWLPLGFLLLPFADTFFLREYVFNNARHSVLPTYAFIGLVLSILLAMFIEMRNTGHKSKVRLVYRWYISIPLIIIVIFLALASMSR